MTQQMRQVLPAHQAGQPEKVKVPVIDLKAKNRDKRVTTHTVDMVTVYFPQGHSTRMSVERARELGYLTPAPVIDMETGEQVQGQVDLSRVVEQKTRRKGYDVVDDVEAAIASEVAGDED